MFSILPERMGGGLIVIGDSKRAHKSTRDIIKGNALPEWDGK